jgi:hypothetical protein
MALSDAARLSILEALSDIAAIVDSSSHSAEAFDSVAESLGVSDALSPILKLYLTSSESLVFAETLSSTGTAYVAVSDAVRLNVEISVDNDTYECYVLNGTSFRVSAYSGFDFNSYAVFENRAYAANASGIWELTGATDNGSPINAGVVLSGTNFGVASNKKLRKAWLGVSGSSPTLLMETEDGERRAYSISSEGRADGERDVVGRTWKLSVAGFDELDSVKLIPVILARGN